MTSNTCAAKALIRKKRIVSHAEAGVKSTHLSAGAMFGDLSLDPSPLAGEIAIVKTAPKAVQTIAQSSARFLFASLYPPAVFCLQGTAFRHVTAVAELVLWPRCNDTLCSLHRVKFAYLVPVSDFGTPVPPVDPHPQALPGQSPSAFSSKANVECLDVAKDLLGELFAGDDGGYPTATSVERRRRRASTASTCRANANVSHSSSAAPGASR